MPIDYLIQSAFYIMQWEYVMKTKITVLFIVLTLCQVTAQDRQFWDQAVGGRTALLGGIAVGGVRDYSATFYNPGALSFLSKNSMNFNV